MLLSSASLKTTQATCLSIWPFPQSLLVIRPHSATPTPTRPPLSQSPLSSASSEPVQSSSQQKPKLRSMLEGLYLTLATQENDNCRSGWGGGGKQDQQGPCTAGLLSGPTLPTKFLLSAKHKPRDEGVLKMKETGQV